MRTGAIYQELAIEEKSATITCVWQRLKGSQKSGEGLVESKGGLQDALIRSC